MSATTGQKLRRAAVLRFRPHLLPHSRVEPGQAVVVLVQLSLLPLCHGHRPLLVELGVGRQTFCIILRRAGLAFSSKFPPKSGKRQCGRATDPRHGGIHPPVAGLPCVPVLDLLAARAVHRNGVPNGKIPNQLVNVLVGARLQVWSEKVVRGKTCTLTQVSPSCSQ